MHVRVDWRDVREVWKAEGRAAFKAGKPKPGKNIRSASYRRCLREGWNEAERESRNG